MTIFRKAFKYGFTLYFWGWLLIFIPATLGIPSALILSEVPIWMRLAAPIVTPLLVTIFASKAEGNILPHRRAWILVSGLSTIANGILGWFYWSHIYAIDTFMITPELNLISCLKVDVVIVLIIFGPLLSYQLIRK